MAATDNRGVTVNRAHFRTRALARTVNPDRQALLSRSAALSALRRFGPEVP